MLYEQVPRQIFKDVSELYARLIDHRPVLQGHMNFFVKEFEERRGNRENLRLEKIDQELSEMNTRLIPESEEAMKVFLVSVTAKLKAATEVCGKIEEKDGTIEAESLKMQKDRRREIWNDFMIGQCQKSALLDKEFEEQVKNLELHYKELEEGLKQSSKLSP